MLSYILEVSQLLGIATLIWVISAKVARAEQTIDHLQQFLNRKFNDFFPLDLD